MSNVFINGVTVQLQSVNGSAVVTLTPEVQGSKREITHKALIKSDTTDKVYSVYRYSDGNYSCNCDAFYFRNVVRGEAYFCKHTVKLTYRHAVK